MIRFIIITLTVILLAGCSKDPTYIHYRPDFINTIDDSHNTFLVLEPEAVAYTIKSIAKVNHTGSKQLQKVVKEAAIAALHEKQYHTKFWSDTSAHTTELKKQLKRDIVEYINGGRPENSEILNYNIGQTPIKLGKISNTDLIVSIKYKSSFRMNKLSLSNGLLFMAIDEISGSGFTKKEVCYCEVVFIDAKTGDVVYSNIKSIERAPLFGGVSDKEYYQPGYYKHVISLIQSTLPSQKKTQ